MVSKGRLSQMPVMHVSASRRAIDPLGSRDLLAGSSCQWLMLWIGRLHAVEATHSSDWSSGPWPTRPPLLALRESCARRQPLKMLASLTRRSFATCEDHRAITAGWGFCGTRTASSLQASNRGARRESATRRPCGVQEQKIDRCRHRSRSL